MCDRHALFRLLLVTESEQVAAGGLWVVVLGLLTLNRACKKPVSPKSGTLKSPPKGFDTTAINKSYYNVVLQNILETENEYSKELQNVLSTYLRPLQTSEKLGSANTAHLMGNLEEICSFQHMLVQALEECTNGSRRGCPRFDRVRLLPTGLPTLSTGPAAPSGAARSSTRSGRSQQGCPRSPLEEHCRPVSFVPGDPGPASLQPVLCSGGPSLVGCPVSTCSGSAMDAAHPPCRKGKRLCGAVCFRSMSSSGFLRSQVSDPPTQGCSSDSVFISLDSKRSNVRLDLHVLRDRVGSTHDTWVSVWSSGAGPRALSCAESLLSLRRRSEGFCCGPCPCLRLPLSFRSGGRPGEVLVWLCCVAIPAGDVQYLAFVCVTWAMHAGASVCKAPGKKDGVPGLWPVRGRAGLGPCRASAVRSGSGAEGAVSVGPPRLLRLGLRCEAGTGRGLRSPPQHFVSVVMSRR
ncbi:Rho guanine nucleotide exchange factor 7 [Tupaia chinensis]|uniref:Rho guanine nucleotide exchange factor 7 n=1 Tax=Tupaia chinensis TaxID=246437 RepID=L9JB47_TUPCH|nr:Rho guanine nucleotide exchange factor 7 [Tupaia chinensis]